MPRWRFFRRQPHAQRKITTATNSWKGKFPGCPLYHVSLHIHFKEPYYAGVQSRTWPQRDWYIGGLSSFRRNRIRGPIVVESQQEEALLSFPLPGVVLFWGMVALLVALLILLIIKAH